MSQAPAETSRWIPVTERLPEIHRAVLLFTSDWETLALGYLDGKEDFFVLSLGYSKDSTISHWMELPEAAHAEPEMEATK